MKCPKCNTQIAEDDYICPNCKKVLKLKCPNCGKLSTKTICQDCGTVLLNKCYKCGRMNFVTTETCPKCGLDVNASIGLRESVIEEFAVLTIEITNLDEIKEIFNSDKLKEQFKQNIYELIKKPAAQKKLRIQIINDTFIIRFNKDYSFTDSCLSAVDFSVYIAQSLTVINKKLFDTKGVAIKVQMAIQKRDVYAKQEDYKSGININVVYSTCGASHIFNNIETVVDYYVYQEAKNEYPFQSLSAVCIKEQMVLFFELILHKLIKLKTEKKPSIDKMALPQSAEYVPEEENNEQNLLNFSGLNCTFLRAKGETLLSKLETIKNKNLQNPIVSIKREQKNDFLPLVSEEEIKNIFNDSQIFRFNCPKDEKYSIYGLLKRMLLQYRNITEEEVLLTPALIESITSETYLQDLLRLKTSDHSHPEDLKFSYYEAFSLFIRSIPYKTIFVIEDFQNADETSLEIIRYLIENDELGNVGFIVTNDMNYSLHRKIYGLMTCENYFEIEMKPSSNKAILTQNLSKIVGLEQTFHLEKILENTKGSHFYFNQALQLLVNEDIFEYKESKYIVKNDRMAVIPKNIDEIFQKRLNLLKNSPQTFELFAALLLISEKTSMNTVRMLGFADDLKIINYLSDNNFVKIVDNRFVVVNNYNIFRENLNEICTQNELAAISKTLLEKFYINTAIPNKTKAELLEIAKLKKEAFTQWHSLAMISSQIGDFCAYLNCTNKFLSLVDNIIDNDTNKSIEEIKLEVYSELASMLYKYYPDKIITFLETILTHFEEKNDTEKIKEIANKLVQSCLISGNYNNALEYLGKVIAQTQKSSFNPSEPSFNLKYFLTHLVMIEIYFNLGRLNECIDLGDELFKHIDLLGFDDKILPEGFSRKQFEDSLFDALFFINLSRIIQMKPDTRERLEALCANAGEYKVCFMLLLLIQDYIENKDIISEMTKIAQIGLPDKYSQMLFPFLQGIISMKFQDWQNLGNYIYNAKIKASALNLHQFNYFCDLMIGFAYQKLQNLKKSRQIYYDILNISSEKGLKNINYACLYLISHLELQEGNSAITQNILNNCIMKMENDTNASEFFLILFKSFSSQVLLSTNDYNNAEKTLFLSEQAFGSALNNKLYICLPQLADTLMYIYSQIGQSSQSEAVIKEFTEKMNNVKNIMENFFQQQA